MPLSLNVCPVIDNNLCEPKNDGFYGPMAGLPHTVIESIPLSSTFEILSSLLLGHLYSKEYVKSAVLVSAWGWSIFFDSIDAIDPLDVSVDSMRVVCGVPTRQGRRRSRIIDGPTACRKVLVREGISMSVDTTIRFSPNISTASRGLTWIGARGDAFQVTQTHSSTESTSDRFSIGKEQTHKLGFREMQELCLQVRRLPSCQCDTVTPDIVAWSRERRFAPPCEQSRVPHDAVVETSDGRKICWVTVWPERKPNPVQTAYQGFVKSLVQHDHRAEDANHGGQMFTKGPTLSCVFHVSQNPDARWLQLKDICSSVYEQRVDRVIRGRGTCFTCATDASAPVGSKPTLLLL